MNVNSVLEAEMENVIKIKGSSVSSQSSKVLSDSLAKKQVCLKGKGEWCSLTSQGHQATLQIECVLGPMMSQMQRIYFGFHKCRIPVDCYL